MSAARVDINRALRASPRSCRYGAPVGARNDTSGGLSGLYLQRLRLVDGDYGADGTYWGASRTAGHMWAAFLADLSTLIYVRGHTRADAAKAVAKEAPGVSFKRTA